MGKYNVRITKNKQGHHVFRARRVIKSIKGQATPITVATSATVGVRTLPEAGFTETQIEAHRDRAKDGGSKGRVLYVLADGVPIAFMGIHRPDSGPITGEAVVASSTLASRQQRIVIESMLECATEISVASKRRKGALGWTTNSDATRRLLVGFEFATSKKPKWCDRTHYLLRSET